jgi:myo-inositol-1(or 4)-monophosphatase
MRVGTGIQPYPELEAIAVAAALEGAAVIRASDGRLGDVRMKSGPTDPVTALDLEVERVVRDHLAKVTPEAAILGEELGRTAGTSRLGWVLDPIDGTVNLTYDLPVVGVSLAATSDGEVVASAIVDVVRGETFSAFSGGGARREGQPIRPTSVGLLADSLVATGFAYAAESRASESGAVGRVLPAARDVRNFGSTALHLCWVACGRLDGYFQRGMPWWDYAAGALIAHESGARVQTPSPGNGELLVASSPHIFEALLALVA